uniref:Uncharacterized protein n=1 Tax=Timema tahoe TaxID=61484 RepID=A0A7R9ILG0_9NEOP|nr:unnamed protein product [Timema tahoe]
MEGRRDVSHSRPSCRPATCIKDVMWGRLEVEMTGLEWGSLGGRDARSRVNPVTSTDLSPTKECRFL